MSNKKSISERAFSFDCSKEQVTADWFIKLVGELRTNKATIAMEWVANQNQDFSFRIDPTIVTSDCTVVIFIRDETHVIGQLCYELQKRAHSIAIVQNMFNQVSH